MRSLSMHYKFVVTSMFVSIILILSFTPLGFIQLGFIKATLVHIPVILGSIFLGPKSGALLGGLFGLTSLIVNTSMPSVLSFAFSPFIPLPGTSNGSFLALVVCFIPRILVGIIPYFVYKLFRKKLCSKEWLALVAAGIIGSMINTLLVLNLIYFLFNSAYASIKNVTGNILYGTIMTIVAVNGIPEAIVSGIVVTALGKVLLNFKIISIN